MTTLPDNVKRYFQHILNQYIQNNRFKIQKFGDGNSCRCPCQRVKNSTKLYGVDGKSYKPCYIAWCLEHERYPRNDREL